MSDADLAAENIERAISRYAGRDMTDVVLMPMLSVGQARAAVECVREVPRLADALAQSEADVARLASLPARQAERILSMLDAIEARLIVETDDMSSVQAGLRAAASVVRAVSLGDAEARARVDELRRS